MSMHTDFCCDFFFSKVFLLEGFSGYGPESDLVYYVLPLLSCLVSIDLMPAYYQLYRATVRRMGICQH